MNVWSIAKFLIYVSVLSNIAVPRAHSATQTFNDPNLFQLALGGSFPIVQGFENLPLGIVISDNSIIDGVSYSFLGQPVNAGRISNQFNGIGTRNLGADSQLGFFFPGQIISITFATPVRAVGGFFNIGSGPIDSIFLQTTLFDIVNGGGPADRPDTNGLYFLGVISDRPITQALFGTQFTAPTGFNFDNLVYLSAAIPEPESWAMMIAGFGIVGGIARRNRRPKISISNLKLKKA